MFSLQLGPALQDFLGAGTNVEQLRIRGFLKASMLKFDHQRLHLLDLAQMPKGWFDGLVYATKCGYRAGKQFQVSGVALAQAVGSDVEFAVVRLLFEATVDDQVQFFFYLPELFCF